MKKPKQVLTKFLKSKTGRWIWLAAILLLFVLKIWLGYCTLWLCGLFVAVVVAYTIFTNKEDN